MIFSFLMVMMDLGNIVHHFPIESSREKCKDCLSSYVSQSDTHSGGRVSLTFYCDPPPPLSPPLCSLSIFMAPKVMVTHASRFTCCKRPGRNRNKGKGPPSWLSMEEEEAFSARKGQLWSQERTGGLRQQSRWTVTVRPRRPPGSQGANCPSEVQGERPEECQSAK